MLKVYCLVDKGENIKKFKERMNYMYPCEFIEKEVDFSQAKWVKKNGRKYLDRRWYVQYTKDIYEKYGKEIDFVHCFPSPKNWQNGRVALWGFARGATSYSYYVMATKMRKKYDDTAIHEMLHPMDSYIKKHAGMSLEQLFNVKDFDEHIVHAEKYDDYEYKEVWQKLAPLLNLAIKNRREGNEPINWASILGILKNMDKNTYEIKYFEPDEFDHWEKMDKEFMQKIDQLREDCGFPFVVTSDYRPDDKKAHGEGKALDIALSGNKFYENMLGLYNYFDSGREIYNILKSVRNEDGFWSEYKDRQSIAVRKALQHGFNRIGIYKKHVHLDTSTKRTQNVVWVYDKD